MTPTQTNTLMRLAYAQWPHIEQTPELIDVWHSHLQHTDRETAAEALRNVLAVSEYPPTIAKLKEAVTVIQRRKALLKPAIGPGNTRPATIADQICSAKAPCRWIEWLHNAYTETTFAALSSKQRVDVIRSHARAHADSPATAGIRTIA